MSNLDAPVNNTPYSDEELDHFKDLLKNKKRETRQEIETLKERLEDLTSNQKDKQSGAAHHQGDIASGEDEREKFLIMIEKKKKTMAEIKAALDRIELGTYGVCESTGEKIQKERLEAIPHARFSIEAKK
jgi:RNA polymerase-binding protein DksA